MDAIAAAHRDWRTIRNIDMSSSTAEGGREVEQPKWEWMDTIFGAVLGVFGAVATMTGWTGRKFTDVHQAQDLLRKDMDQKIADLHERVTPLAEDVAELRAHHEAKMQRLVTIEGSMREIDRKQDEQMQILYRLAEKHRGGRHGDE